MEKPLFTKCCKCIPLKPCLQLWVGAKILVNVTLTVMLLFTYTMVTLHHYDYSRFFDYYGLEHVLLTLAVVLVIDLAFNIVLSVGLCQNNVKKMVVFFNYNTFMTSAVAVILCWLTFRSIAMKDPPALLVSLLVFDVLHLGFNTAVLLTTRNEILKLKSKQKSHELVSVDTSIPDANGAVNV